MTEEQVKLTQFSHGSGCGCKIDPAMLEKILHSDQEKKIFDSLIGGYETNDDSAVWDLDGENYLLSTTDFFTPIVDDAFDFGRIAAANALSDIYAMGGKPSFALAVLGFPVQKLDVEIARQIIAGAKHICKEADIPLAGGHSIDITEPVFGLVVNGIVKKEFLKKNNSAKAGDILFLTKPLGTGIMSAALKRGKIEEKDLQLAVISMTSLNDAGYEIAKVKGVSAMTDITGFGFLGHLIEMCKGSDLSAEINYQNIPLLPGIEKYTSQFIFPDNTYRNWNAYEKNVSGVNGPEFITLCDPQTSGGLLISVSPDSAEEIQNIFKKQNFSEFLKPVGRMKKRGEMLVEVHI